MAEKLMAATDLGYDHELDYEKGVFYFSDSEDVFEYQTFYAIYSIDLEDMDIHTFLADCVASDEGSAMKDDYLADC